MKKNLYIDRSQIKKNNFKVLLDDYLIQNSSKVLKDSNLEKIYPIIFGITKK